jgi:virulence factor
MIKLGIVDFDTCHVSEFTRRLHHQGIDQNQWVDGARVVMGYPGTSEMLPEEIPPNLKMAEECGVQLVRDPREMIGKIDGVLIESVVGKVHLERVKPFLEAGIPAFIDKPFACSIQDAEAMIRLAEKNKTPIFSCSALRFAVEVVNLRNQLAEVGNPVAVHVFGVQGAETLNPGWYNYAIHSVEMLFALMGGAGHRDLHHVATGFGEQLTTTWKPNSVASIAMTTNTKNDYPFGFTYIGEKKTITTRLQLDLIYRELVKQIVKFFQTGKAPVPIEETLEILKFIEATNKLIASKKKPEQKTSLVMA